MFDTLKGTIKGAADYVRNKFIFKSAAETLTLAPMPTTRMKPLFDAPQWWRNPCFTPAMSHKLRNDKGLMYAENTLLQGLLLRHFKEVA